jgi:hypothetical protein
MFDKKAQFRSYPVLAAMLLALPSHSVAQPANDLCSNAQVISAQGTISGSTAGATWTNVAPGCGPGNEFVGIGDIWYVLPAASVPRQVTIQAAIHERPDGEGGTETYCQPTGVFTGCPTEPFEHLIACSDCNSPISYLAPANQATYIRVANDIFEGGVPFTMSVSWVSLSEPLPPGDLCTGPLPISPNSQVTGSLVGYSGNSGNVAFPGNGNTLGWGVIDVWYQLSIGPGQAGMYTIDTTGSTIDTSLTVYSACPGGESGSNRLAYNDDINPLNPDVLCTTIGNQDARVYLALQEGTYLVRVSTTPYAPAGAYALNVSSPSTPIPGDLCENALPLAPNTVAFGNTTGLTGFNQSFGCVAGSNDRIDAWFSYTALQSGWHDIDTSGSSIDTTLRVYNRCGSGAQLACNDDVDATNSARTYVFMSAGQTYPIRVAGFRPCFNGPFQLIVRTPPWSEPGDAGDLPTTAAAPQGTGSLVSIDGELGVNDVDMYVIEICDVESFQATTIFWANFNTQLSLFDRDGQGVVLNDEVFGMNNFSLLTDQFVQAQDVYLLAISNASRDPVNSANQKLWLDEPAVGERAPDGPGASSPVAGWSGAAPMTGNYRIELAGVCFPTVGPICNDIDINNDGSSFDPTDIEAFLSVFSEGPCVPDTALCDEIDFNNDESLFDPCDIDSFMLVFSEGPCTSCGL